MISDAMPGSVTMALHILILAIAVYIICFRKQVNSFCSLIWYPFSDEYKEVAARKRSLETKPQFDDLHAFFRPQTDVQ